MTMKQSLPLWIVMVSSLSAVEVSDRFVGPCEPTRDERGYLQPCRSTNADFVLGGFVHVNGAWDDETNSCRLDRADSFQFAEVVRHAVDLVNQRLQESAIPIVFGYDLQASCADMPDREQQMVTFSFIQRTPGQWAFNGQDEDCLEFGSGSQYATGESVDRERPPISALLGPSTSRSTVQAAQLASAFRLPVVSYTATAPNLGCKCDFPYFLRVVPPDTEQAEVIAQFAMENGWSYINVVYGTDFSSVQLAEAFRKAAERRGLCIGLDLLLNIDLAREQGHLQMIQHVISELIPNVSGVNTSIFLIVGQRQGLDSYINLVQNVLIPFLRARNRSFAVSPATFLGTAGWAFADDIIPHRLVPEFTGAIGFSPHGARDATAIHDHFVTLRPANSSDNPFFLPSWMAAFNCSLKVTATVQERERCESKVFIRGKSLHLDARLSGAFDATQGILQAMNATIETECRRMNGLGNKSCSADMLNDTVRQLRHRRLDGNDLLAMLREREITSFLDDVMTRFDPNSNNPLRVPYAIGNAQVTRNGSALHYVTVGRGIVEDVGRKDDDCRRCSLDYSEVKNLSVELQADQKLIRWKGDGNTRPETKCSRPCEPGFGAQAERTREGKLSKCCFTCSKCTGQTFSDQNNDNCSECNATQAVNSVHSACIDLELEYYGKTVVAQVMLSISIALMLCTLVYIVLLYSCPRTRSPTRRPLLTMMAIGTLIIPSYAPLTLLQPTQWTCTLIILLPSAGLMLALAPVVVMSVHHSRLPARVARSLRAMDHETETHQSGQTTQTGERLTTTTRSTTTAESSQRPTTEHSTTERGESEDSGSADENRDPEGPGDVTGQDNVNDITSHAPGPNRSALDETGKIRRMRRRRKAKKILSGLQSKIVASMIIGLSCAAIILSASIVSPIDVHTLLEPHGRLVESCQIQATANRVSYALYTFIALFIIANDARTLLADRRRQRRLGPKRKSAAKRRIATAVMVLLGFLLALATFFLAADPLFRPAIVYAMVLLYGIAFFIFSLVPELSLARYAPQDRAPAQPDAHVTNEVDQRQEASATVLSSVDPSLRRDCQTTAMALPSADMGSECETPQDSSRAGKSTQDGPEGDTGSAEDEDELAVDVVESYGSLKFSSLGGGEFHIPGRGKRANTDTSHLTVFACSLQEDVIGDHSHLADAIELVGEVEEADGALYHTVTASV